MIDPNSYNYLFEGDEQQRPTRKIKPETIVKRFKTLKSLLEQFIADRKIQDLVLVQDYLVTEVILNYFSDIVRLKDFHNIEKTSPLKVAAYTSYWIYKNRPIQLIKEITDEMIEQKPYIHSINHWFASFILITMSFVTTQRNKMLLEDEKQWMKLMDQLNYHFEYRIVTAQSLELFLEALITKVPHEQK